MAYGAPERSPSKIGEDDIRAALDDRFDLIDMALRYLEGEGA
jgi:hypothetical protein